MCDGLCGRCHWARDHMEGCRTSAENGLRMPQSVHGFPYTFAWLVNTGCCWCLCSLHFWRGTLKPRVLAESSWREVPSGRGGMVGAGPLMQHVESFEGVPERR